MTTKFKRTKIEPNMHMRWEIDYNVLRFATNRINIDAGLNLTMMQVQQIILALEKCEKDGG